MSTLDTVYKDGIPRDVQRKLRAVLPKTDAVNSYEAFNVREGLNTQIHDKWVGPASTVSTDSWVTGQGTWVPTNVYSYADASSPTFNSNTNPVVSTGTAKHTIFDKIQVYESAKSNTILTAASLEAAKDKFNPDVPAAQDVRTWIIAENTVYIVSMVGVAALAVGLMMSRAAVPEPSNP